MLYRIVNKTEQKRRKKRIVGRITLCAVLIVVLTIFVLVSVYKRAMTPTLLDIADTVMQSRATQIINNAVLTVLDFQMDCDSFVTVTKNSNDDVVMISANSLQANKLAMKASLLTQQKIGEMQNSEVNIPIGNLSGIPLLNNRGPIVSVTLSPVGKVVCRFVSQFSSVGINQTLHRIYLNVEATVDLILPTTHRQSQIFAPILLCETVIVGKVPQTFLQGDLLLGSS